jgi:CheY-like chemotaxis protein
MSEGGRVLIVDDDVAFAQSIGDLLEAYGYEVHTAHDGASGLEMARRILPDVMILDVMMTTATEGFEVARKIPESPELKRMGVLLVTGVAKSLRAPGGLKPDQTWLPVDRILEKPIAPDHLMIEMEHVLKERRKA